jgi:DNA-binding SARP family transcriptional activator
MSEAVLRVEVLGQVRAWLGDEVALGPARQRAVFAMLAARAGRPVSRGELVDGVWGDAAPASAAGNVHTYISGLRRTLDPGRSRWTAGGVLRSEPAGYRLLLAPADLDLHLFRDLRRQARARADAGEHRRATELLDAALALWRGEAFAGVPGPFAERHRAHLAEERLAAVEARLHSLLALGEHAEVVAELAVLVRAHPLRESMWATLITALHRGGRHAEALEGVTHVRKILREELGTAPGPRIRLLHQQLLAGAPEPAPAEPFVERVAGLSPATREMLRQAALLGTEFTLTRVAALMSTPPSALVDAVDEALAAAVLVERGVKLAFRHPLLRQAIGRPDAA